MRKTENKVAFRINLKSLMTNMAIFFVSVASIPRKITVITANMVISKLRYNPNSLGDFSQKQQKIPSLKNFEYFLFEKFEKFAMWRHNGFFDIFLCGTLIPSILVQFSSNLHIYLTLQCMTLYWIANQRFPLISLIQHGRPINEKIVTLKTCVNRK